MNLAQLRAEVLNRGFDPQAFGSRITQYLNDAQNLVARRVDYYLSEATWATQTTPGQMALMGPGNVARIRDVSNTDIDRTLEYCSTRDIDNSPSAQGQPRYYAVAAASVQLYPTPDGVYNLQLRYWAMPPALVNDSDNPTMPDDWEHLLITYATAICFETEDDAQMGQYWMGRFNNELSMFSADVKFPTADGPNQAASMWEGERSLSVSPGWSGGGGSSGNIDGGGP